VRGIEQQTVYDKPPPAVGVLAAALNISIPEAKAALRELISAGYVIAPREPTNSMLVAYFESYGKVATNPNTFVVGIGKARRRWAAMGKAGTAVALSTKAIPDET
jgi:hypothetical protein